MYKLIIRKQKNPSAKQHQVSEVAQACKEQIVCPQCSPLAFCVL